MKKNLLKKITAIVMAAMTTASIASAADFTDTNELNDVQMTVLNDAINKGIINGYEDGTVRPYNTLTRAEFAAMICRYMGYPTDAGCTFSDAAEHWATSYIQACVNKNAINGIGNNLFAPEAPVTFNQASKIVSIVSGMTNGFNIEELGGYPLAYLTVGQNSGLFNNLIYGFTGSDYELSRIDAITMISNANTETAAEVEATPLPENAEQKTGYDMLKDASSRIIDIEATPLHGDTFTRAEIDERVNAEIDLWITSTNYADEADKQWLYPIIRQAFYDILTGSRTQQEVKEALETDIHEYYKNKGDVGNWYTVYHETYDHVIDTALRRWENAGGTYGITITE